MRYVTPPPHVVEHGVHSPHGVQLPGAERKIIFSLNILLLKQWQYGIFALYCILYIVSCNLTFVFLQMQILQFFNVVHLLMYNVVLHMYVYFIQIKMYYNHILSQLILFHCLYLIS